MSQSSETMVEKSDADQIPHNFHFDGRQNLSHNLIASVADVLDSIEIPFVLWGNCLLTTYGVPTVVDVWTLRLSQNSLSLLTSSGDGLRGSR